MNSEKTAIRNAFAKAAPEYDSTASIQQQVAHDLSPFILNFISPQSPRTGIDLGCGTGFLTKELRRQYPDLKITLNDLAAEMIEKSLSNNQDGPTIDILQGDMETLQTDRTWDLAASNFVWQWLENPHTAIRIWATRSTHLVLSFPLEGSFPEWKELHSCLSLPIRLRILPSLEELLLGLKSASFSAFETQEKTYTQTFDTPLDFARQLKATGAALPSTPPSSSLRKIRRLNNGPFTVTWKVAFLACHSRSPRL